VRSVLLCGQEMMSYKNCEKRGTRPTKNAETVEQATKIGGR